MDFLDAFWHLANLLAPGVMVGTLACSLTKLVWRQSLRSVSWGHMLTWACGAGVAAVLVALVLLGRDGTMLGYLGLVLSVAGALWWSALRHIR